MRLYYKPHLKDNSRKLRKTMTESEVILWNKIRRKQLKNLQFNRQKPLGKYVVDFYCPLKKLVIEIDGGQHYDNGKITKKDLEREKFIKEILGLKIVRFTNIEIKQNLASVIDKILETLK